MFSWLFRLLSDAKARKKRDEKWAENWTNSPADSKNKLPLDPGKSNLS